MNRILLRIVLLLVYLGVLAYILYPSGSSLTDPDGLRWLLTMGGTLLIIVVLFLLLRYRQRRREKYSYGYYDEAQPTDKSDQPEG